MCNVQSLTEQCLLGLLALLGLFCPFWRFPFYIPTLLPPLLSLAVLIVRTPTEGHLMCNVQSLRELL